MRLWGGSLSKETVAPDDDKADKLWQRWAAVHTIAVSFIGVLAFFGITNFDQLKTHIDPTPSPSPSPTQSVLASSPYNGFAPLVSSTTPAPIPSTTSPAPPPTTPIEANSPSSPPESPTFTPPDAEHGAQVGDCVYGTAGPGQQWNIANCAKGNFTVLAVYTATANTSVCSSGWGIMQRYYTFADSEHDEVLCLRYNYFSDIGYGTVNECFAASGPSNSLTFSYTSTCTAGDVVVVAQPRVDRLLQHPQLIPYAEPGSSSTMRRSQADCRAKTWAASFKPAWRS